MQNTETLDLGTMLDETLDLIPDAPEYVTPPAGEYRLSVKDCKIEKYETKSGKSGERIRIIYSIETTYSTADNEQPVPDGSMFSETFTREGLSYFKTRVKNILNVSTINGVSLRDVMDTIKGATFDARITIKRIPNPNGGEYENVQIRVISPK